MTTNLTFDFTVDTEKKTITVEREFAAERPLVWDAYTKREILDQWWAPKPWKAKTKSLDFKEGGKWVYAMVGPKGEEQWCLANYKSIQAKKKFTWLDAFADPKGNVNKDMPQSKWELSFSDKGQYTLVHIQISYDELKALEETIKMGFKDGLALAMENLDELLPSLKK